jgi:hypothetical protein
LVELRVPIWHERDVAFHGGRPARMLGPRPAHGAARRVGASTCGRSKLPVTAVATDTVVV